MHCPCATKAAGIDRVIAQLHRVTVTILRRCHAAPLIVVLSDSSVLNGCIRRVLKSLFNFSMRMRGRRISCERCLCDSWIAAPV